MKANDTTDGMRAERLAAAFLQRQGLVVVARNYRVRGGEIDLVCRTGNVLVFVEVRLRRREDFGGAAASITTSKRRRLLLAARHYLARRPEALCRFDCILMNELSETAIDWVQDAFSADDC